MTFPAITAFYAGILGLIYLGLSSWVVAGRGTKKMLFGDGGDDAMMRRVRSHANFQEYVPLALILIGFLEAGGGDHTVVRVLLAVLAVARLMHPVGMMAKANTPPQYIFRGVGAVATFAVVGVASIMLLVQVG